MKALLIVDVQNDFCPGGALPAPNGDKIIPLINELTDRFSLVVASKDAHPVETRHFEKWPPHCVAGTEGAEFHPVLNTGRINKVFLKGTGDRDDGYSAFEATSDDLEDFLKSRSVSDLYICGLTTEYCVKNSALDAANKGFRTLLVEDAIAAVEPGTDNEKHALHEMELAGIERVRQGELN